MYQGIQEIAGVARSDNLVFMMINKTEKTRTGGRQAKIRPCH